MLWQNLIKKKKKSGAEPMEILCLNKVTILFKMLVRLNFRKNDKWLQICWRIRCVLFLLYFIKLRHHHMQLWQSYVLRSMYKFSSPYTLLRMVYTMSSIWMMCITQKMFFFFFRKETYAHKCSIKMYVKYDKKDIGSAFRENYLMIPSGKSVLPHYLWKWKRNSCIR